MTHREILVRVLIVHARTASSGCHCGWMRLGESYAEHVADEYEDALRALRPRDPYPSTSR